MANNKAIFRTDETEEKYAEYRKDGHMQKICNLCEKASSVKEFNYWKVVENLFPWDRIAKTHNMIMPKRHVTYENLSDKEKKEFDEIKSSYIEPEYQFIMETTAKMKTIPSHFHLHLIISKDKF